MENPIQTVRAAAIVMLAISALFLFALNTMHYAPARESSVNRPLQLKRPNATSTPATEPRTTESSLQQKPASEFERARLIAENQRLREANAVLQDRLRALLQWIIANFRGRFPVPENLLAQMNVPVLTDEDLLNPQLSELLRLSADEEERLNDALAYAVEYLTDIESAILTVSEPRPGKIILHIPTFKDNGQLLKEDLFAALEATLGRDRFDRFLKVAGAGLNERFYHFGEASRTMVFELVYNENETTPRLLIKDGYVLEIGSDTRQISAVETVVTNLPQKYTAYLAWLPDYMAYATEKP